MTEAHAFIAPSSLHRTRKCSAAPWMESQFPDLSDETARREGIACHWVMVPRLTRPFEEWIKEGDMAPNGVMVTRAMIEGVELLAKDVADKLGPQWPSLLVVERPVAIPRIHPTHCWGTPDLRGWVQKEGRWWLNVWDLKFGFKRIEVFENDQLVAYAAGCLTEAKVQPEQIAHIAVCLTVVQPRAYHVEGPVRDWITTADKLNAQVDTLALAADEATGAAPVCRPDPDACENCRARSGCDALQEAAYRGMDIARKAVPRELGDEALGLELALLDDVGKLLKARQSGLEELVKSRLSSGRRIPHWHYAAGRGATKWTRPAAEVVALGRMFGVELAQPLDVVTPIQAKAAGLPMDYAKPFVQTVSGAVTLARATEANTRKIFTLTNL